MINLVESPFGREIKNMTKETFIERISPYINKDLSTFILAEDKVEVTYNPKSKVCRFDFVNIESILDKNFISDSQLDEEYPYEFFNIDLNFDENRLIFYIELDSLNPLLESLTVEDRMSLISIYTNLKTILKKEGFYLDVCKDSTMCLITNNLKCLTVDKISDVLNEIEKFRKTLVKFELL